MEDERNLINGSVDVSVSITTVIETKTEEIIVEIDKCETKKEKSSFSCSEILFLIILSAVTVTSSLALCIFPPFFPRIAENKGFGATVYGSVIGTNCLVAFLVTPLIGRHIRTLGLKFSLICGIAASGVSSVLCGMLEVHPAGNLFICSAVSIRTVQSLGNALIIISTFVYTSIKFPDNTGTIFALNRTALSVAQMIGPALGGVLYDWSGYYLPFVTFGILHLLTALPLLFLAPNGQEMNEIIQEKNCEERVNNCRVLRLSGIWVSFAMFFVSTLSTGFLSITLESQILRKYHLTHIYLGLMFGLKDAASTVTSPLWGMACDRYQYTKLFLIICCLAAAASYVVFGPLPGLAIHQTLYLVGLGLCIYGGAIGGMQICGVMDALREATGRGGLPNNSTTHGVVAGLWNSLSSGGRFISRCGAGILVDNLGFPYSSSIIVLLHLILGFVTILYTCSLSNCFRIKKLSMHHVNGKYSDLSGSPILRPRLPTPIPEENSDSDPPSSDPSSDDSSENFQHTAALCVPGVRIRTCSETAVSYLISSSQTYLGPNSYHTLN